MNIPSAALREIHRIHRQLTELQSRLVRGPRQAATAETTVAGFEKQLENAKKIATKSRVAVDQKELQLKEREGRIEDVKRKLNTCKSNREYQALMEQIAADDQANSVLSDEILELYDRIAAEQEDVKKAEDHLNKTTAELDKIRKRVSEEHHLLETDLGRLTQQLQVSEDELPEEIRADYHRMVKGRGDEALAPLEGGCCGGCFQQTTSQMLNELHLGQFVLCKSCGRILYLPEDARVG